jgi:hypothetical protein
MGKYLSIIMDTPIRRAEKIVRYAINMLSSIIVFIDTKIRIISERDKTIPTNNGDLYFFL